MRFAFTQCIAELDHPLAVYTNLNRYYTLEPLCDVGPTPCRYHVWVLANIVVGLHESVEAYMAASNDQSIDIGNLLELIRPRCATSLVHSREAIRLVRA